MKKTGLMLTVLLAALCMGTAGCGEAAEEEAVQAEYAETAAAAETESTQGESSEPEDSIIASYEATEPQEGITVIEEGEEEPSAAPIAEDGVYTSKEDVSLYIYTYGYLPENFITKKEARQLGWEGGSLEPYAPGKCIGGDVFGNYEGILPEDASYHECDIDTLGASSRGAKRIVYSDDGKIYYTQDHYESFELLYEGGANQ